MNLETLEHRLQALIRRLSSNHSQQPQQPANFSSGTTMIPTPGISHNQNANVISSSSVGASMVSVNSSMTTTNVNTGSLLPTSGGLSMGINNGILMQLLAKTNFLCVLFYSADSLIFIYVTIKYEFCRNFCKWVSTITC